MPESMMKERGRRIAFPRREVKFLNPYGLPNTPKLWVKCVPIEGTDEAYRFACVELVGGDHLPPYSAELPGLVGRVSYHPVRPNGNLDPGDVERLQPLPGSPYPWGDRRREAL